MKSLTKYLNEKLVINKYYKNSYTYAPTSFDELREIIEDRYDKLGAGTKTNPIDFNDVDVSNISSFYDENINIGIFERTKFEYIDISDWDVSKVKDMSYMFCGCNNLISVGDLSNWNVSKVEGMSVMFSNCEQLKSVGDLSNWKVSGVKNMFYMFQGCEQLKSVGDLSNWDVSKVENMWNMFYSCKQLKSVGDLSNWDVSKVKYMFNMFKESGIINIPDWYK